MALYRIQDYHALNSRIFNESRQHERSSSIFYLWIMRILGAALLMFSALLCVDGFRLLGFRWL